MKRFVWRLQRVLDIKEKEEQLKRAELLALTEELVQRRGELLTLQTILENMITDLSDKKPLQRLSEQEMFMRYSRTSDARIKELKSKISGLECEQRTKIGDLLKVRRFKKGLEKLRAETKRQFICVQEKLEQKELDESAVMRFARKAQNFRTSNAFE